MIGWLIERQSVIDWLIEHQSVIGWLIEDRSVIGWLIEHRSVIGWWSVDRRRLSWKWSSHLKIHLEAVLKVTPNTWNQNHDIPGQPRTKTMIYDDSSVLSKGAKLEHLSRLVIARVAP